MAAYPAAIVSTCAAESGATAEGAGAEEAGADVPAAGTASFSSAGSVAITASVPSGWRRAVMC